MPKNPPVRPSDKLLDLLKLSNKCPEFPEPVMIMAHPKTNLRHYKPSLRSFDINPRIWDFAPGLYHDDLAMTNTVPTGDLTDRFRSVHELMKDVNFPTEEMLVIDSLKQFSSDWKINNAGYSGSFGGLRKGEMNVASSRRLGYGGHAEEVFIPRLPPFRLKPNGLTLLRHLYRPTPSFVVLNPRQSGKSETIRRMTQRYFYQRAMENVELAPQASFSSAFIPFTFWRGSNTGKSMMLDWSFYDDMFYRQEINGLLSSVAINESLKKHGFLKKTPRLP